MRGEHARTTKSTTQPVRIIPACAGSTAWASCRLSWQLGSSPHARGAPRDAQGVVTTHGDHPRMRGEHYASSAASRRWTQDHPRMRGEHLVLVSCLSR